MRKLSLRAKGVWGSDETAERQTKRRRGGTPEVKTANSPGNYWRFISKEISDATGGRCTVPPCENTPAMWLMERREREKGGGEVWGAEGEWARPCEVTPPPLAARCLPGARAAARSDCTSTQTKSSGYASPRPLLELNFPRQMLTAKIDIERNIIPQQSPDSPAKGWDIWCCVLVPEPSPVLTKDEPFFEVLYNFLNEALHFNPLCEPSAIEPE